MRGVYHRGGSGPAGRGGGGARGRLTRRYCHAPCPVVPSAGRAHARGLHAGRARAGRAAGGRPAPGRPASPRHASQPPRPGRRHPLDR
ncbi:MAG: hypothetical protein FIB01_09845 [Gemmatimonadetes bacterium]|nr:hypothetical protein [Gemmatimonadota bacterium]